VMRCDCTDGDVALACCGRIDVSMASHALLRRSVESEGVARATPSNMNMEPARPQARVAVK